MTSLGQYPRTMTLPTLSYLYSYTQTESNTQCSHLPLLRDTWERNCEGECWEPFWSAVQPVEISPAWTRPDQYRTCRHKYCAVDQNMTNFMLNLNWLHYIHLNINYKKVSIFQNLLRIRQWGHYLNLDAHLSKNPHKTVHIIDLVMMTIVTQHVHKKMVKVSQDQVSSTLTTRYNVEGLSSRRCGNSSGRCPALRLRCARAQVTCMRRQSLDQPERMRNTSWVIMMT